jgi:hypothetical protein
MQASSAGVIRRPSRSWLIARPSASSSFRSSSDGTRLFIAATSFSSSWFSSAASSSSSGGTSMGSIQPTTSSSARATRCLGAGEQGRARAEPQETVGRTEARREPPASRIVGVRTRRSPIAPASARSRRHGAVGVGTRVKAGRELTRVGAGENPKVAQAAPTPPAEPALHFWAARRRVQPEGFQNASIRRQARPLSLTVAVRGSCQKPRVHGVSAKRRGRDSNPRWSLIPILA